MTQELSVIEQKLVALKELQASAMSSASDQAKLPLANMQLPVCLNSPEQIESVFNSIKNFDPKKILDHQVNQQVSSHLAKKDDAIH